MGRTWLAVAAVGGFLSVAFGAFAAHSVTDPRAQDLLRTGALYGFVHVLATYAAAPRSRIAPPLFLAGVLLFSGSLWAMALGAPRVLGAITPIGGLAFLSGWAALAWAVLRAPQREEV
jgi:uncharacterized membrane protein YgdD (TMEM256/DUF423 family)